MMLTAMVASFHINPKLAMVFFALVLGILLFSDHQPCASLYGVMRGAPSTWSTRIWENFTGVRVVKSYVRGDPEMKSLRRLTPISRPRRNAHSMAALNMPAMQFVMYSTILCILWFGGRLVTVGASRWGTTGFPSYVLQVSTP